MFSLRGVRHRYESEPVLILPDWSAEQGEHWLLLGPSGSGKTTLLHILAGLLRPSEGGVRVVGRDLAQIRGAALDRFRGQSIGIVFQRLHLVNAISVLDNLLLAQRLAGLAQDRARCLQVLEALNVADKHKARPHSLSQGQAQRVAIARAVVNRPRLILADEPTGNLDDRHCEQVLDLLQSQARQHEATLVIATHDARVKARIDRHLSLEAAHEPA